MIRSSNFEIVYVGAKNSASTKGGINASINSVATPRTFGSSNIVNNSEAKASTALGVNRRKALMVKSEDREEDVVYPLGDDIGDLVPDDSDSNPFDGDDSNWMHSIDVTSFKDMQVDFPVQHQLNEKRFFTERADYSSYRASENLPLTSFAQHREGPSRPRSSRSWTKPSYSYSCLVALALKNSGAGQLTVSEIYDFMCENFPYFRTAPPGWKNSVRHNLSLNKCFQKVEIMRPDGQGRKSCLWSLNPAKASKMDQEVRKWRERDPGNIRESLARPDDLEAIEQGRKGIPINSKLHSRNGDEPTLRTSRPLCPRPADMDRSRTLPSTFVRIAQPPLKQFKSLSSSDEQSQDTSKSSSPQERESLRSVNVLQGGALRVPEGSTPSEVAAKNLEAALHRSPRVAYVTPVKSESAQPALVPSEISFPSLNQCGSPTFFFRSPKDEKGIEREPWTGLSLCSPISDSPMSFGTCAYDTVNSALENNSLLQSALEHSPRRKLFLNISK